MDSRDRTLCRQVWTWLNVLEKAGKAEKGCKILEKAGKFCSKDLSTPESLKGNTPEPSSGDSMLRLGRLPGWLKLREEFPTLELTRDPPEKGEEEVEVDPASWAPKTSLPLPALGLPGPCLFFLLPLCFFSLSTSPSSAPSDGIRLWLLPAAPAVPPVPPEGPPRVLEAL